MLQLFLNDAHLPDLCLAPHENTTLVNGSKVLVEHCTTPLETRQLWRPNLPPGPVQNDSTFTFAAVSAKPLSLCLNAAANASDGSMVSLATCSGAAAQRWVFAAGSYMIRELRAWTIPSRPCLSLTCTALPIILAVLQAARLSQTSV